MPNLLLNRFRYLSRQKLQHNDRGKIIKKFISHWWAFVIFADQFYLQLAYGLHFRCIQHRPCNSMIWVFILGVLHFSLHLRRILHSLLHGRVLSWMVSLIEFVAKIEHSPMFKSSLASLSFWRDRHTAVFMSASFVCFCQQHDS